MTDRQTLHQLIEELPASQLVAAENSLTYYRQKEGRRTLELLARELPLYDTDFYAWAQQQAAALRATDWAALDVEHLAEEVEDLRKTERKAVRSQLRRLSSHLLKWAYQPTRRGESWQMTILDARRLVADGLEENGTLTRELPALFAWAYPRARCEAAKDTGLPLATFPEACPWAVAQVLDEDFWPEASSLS
jgi:Domain of unknown function DUF29